MTNEEAIARIREHKIIHKMNEPRAIYISEALDLAIKALEQQPCKDCISRKAVKEQMLKYGFKAPDMTVTEFVEDCLPSVTPQTKTGKWERYVNDYIKCSKCGALVKSYHSYKYCPKCGCRMVEPQESEE